MAKAKNNSTTKDNPAIKSAIADLRATIPAWEAAEKKRRATYNACKEDIQAVMEKYERHFNPLKGFPRNEIGRRDAELQRVYRKHGYDRAAAISNRLTNKVIKQSKHIANLKPNTIRDLGEQSFAFNLLDVIFGRDFNGPTKDSFHHHVAKLSGVSLYNGGAH